MQAQAFNLRPHFAPVQPTSSNHPGVNYRELWPTEQLRPFIYCYWHLYSKKKLTDPFHYRVITDGCVDIILERKLPPEPFIMGFSKTYEVFSLANEFYYMGVRFFPMAFPILFDCNASLLSNKFQHLEIVQKELATRVGAALSDQPQKFEATMDRLFLEVLGEKSIKYDHRVYDALVEILVKRGNLDLSKEINTGLSIRQLRRLFKYYVGCTPKLFAKVVRFQHLFSGKPSIDALTKNRLFYDAGYYDQAHFIKEFKTLFGTTPGQAE